MRALPPRAQRIVSLAPFTLALAVILGELAQGGGSLPGYAIGVSAAMLGLLILAALIAPAARVQSAVLESWISIISLAAFLLYAGLTAIPAPPGLAHPLWETFGMAQGSISINPSRTIEGAAKLLGIAAAFGVGALSVSHGDDRDPIGRILVVGGLLYILYCLSFHLSAPNVDRYRLEAGLPSSNILATVIGMFLLVAATTALRANRRLRGRGWRAGLTAPGRAPVSFFTLFVATGALMLTGSRGGVLCTVGAALVLAVLIAVRRGRRSAAGEGMAIVVFAGVLGVVAALGAQLTLSRFADFSLDDGRFVTMAAHWGAFMDRPWFGHGLNTFRSINFMYGSPDNWDAIRTIGAAHNIAIQLLEEAGIIGFVLFLGILAPPIVRAVRAAFSSGAGHAWACLAVCVSLLVLVHGMVDFSLNMPAVAALYALILGAFTRRGVPST